MDSRQPFAPIPKGFHFALRVRVTGGDPTFPAGCQIKAEVRDYAGAPSVAGTLTIADGSIARIDDDTIELHMAHGVTAALGNVTASFDLVRTDVAPDVWMGVQVTLPVIAPVTAPDAGA